MVESKASGICFSAWTTIVLAESSDVTILELWNLLKACNFQGKVWIGNFT